MSRKKVSIVSLFISVFLFGSVAVFAQTGSVGGRVFMKDADGVEKPVEGVRIDCYRTDIKQSCRSVTTDKDGNFIIIGLPLISKVIMGVSGPGISPTVIPEIKPGSKDSDKLSVEVEEGDGSVPPEEDVREVAGRQLTGDLSEDQKKQQEEIEKQRAEILEKNKKVEERNEKRMELLKAGEVAFNSKDYATAAVKFQEGYDLDPDYMGSAPTFLNNVAQSHKMFAIEMYNASVKDQTTSTVRPKVAASFTSCLTAALKAHEMATNAKPAEIADATEHKASIGTSESIVKDAFRVLGQLKMNLAGYVGTEEEAAASVALYKSSLGILPKNPDVMAGLTFALYTSSMLSGSDGEKQNSLNYGAKYLAETDKGHSLYAAVQDVVDQLTCAGEYKSTKDVPCTGLKPQTVN